MLCISADKYRSHQTTKQRGGHFLQPYIDVSVLGRGMAGSWESKSSGSSWIVAPLSLQR